MAINAACIVLPLAALSLGQAPGEIRVGSGPYQFAPVFIAKADTVPVTVVVRNRNGKAIAGLDRERFRILEDGSPQVVNAFSVETRAGAETPAVATAPAPESPSTTAPAASPAASRPRYVALLFDDVDTEAKDLDEARNAAMRFLREQMGPGDQMALLTISGKQRLGFTHDRDALAADLAKITSHPRWSMHGLLACPQINPYQAYLIAVLHDPAAQTAIEQAATACPDGQSFFTSSPPPGGQDKCGLKCSFGAPGGAGTEDSPVAVEATADWEIASGASQDTLAVVRAAVNYTAQQPGQRIVVLASSGFFTETLGNQVDTVIRDALRGGVVVNALDAKGLYTESPSVPLSEMGGNVLPLAAYIFDEETKFPMREAQADAMASFAAATGGLYFKDNNDLTLGFERLGLAPEVDYALAFTPNPFPRDGKLHKLTVKLDPPIPGATVEARRGYFAPKGLTATEVQRDLYQAMAATGSASAIPATVEVRPEPGRARTEVHFGVTEASQKLDIVAGLFDANGGYVSGEQAQVDLALKSATFKRLRKSGLGSHFDLHAAPGHYRLRVILMDERTGALSEINRSVQIH